MERERRDSDGEDSSENDELGQVVNEDEKSKIRSETHGKLFIAPIQIKYSDFFQIEIGNTLRYGYSINNSIFPVYCGC